MMEENKLGALLKHNKNFENLKILSEKKKEKMEKLSVMGKSQLPKPNFLRSNTSIDFSETAKEVKEEITTNDQPTKNIETKKRSKGIVKMNRGSTEGRKSLNENMILDLSSVVSNNDIEKMSTSRIPPPTVIIKSSIHMQDLKKELSNLKELCKDSNSKNSLETVVESLSKFESMETNLFSNQIVSFLLHIKKIFFSLSKLKIIFYSIKNRIKSIWITTKKMSCDSKG